jgi:hypothetical protein
MYPLLISISITRAKLFTAVEGLGKFQLVRLEDSGA